MDMGITLWVMDENLEVVRIISTFQTLIWHSKWFLPGDFYLVCSDEYRELAAGANDPLKVRYLFRPDSRYVGRVDYTIFDNKMLHVRGRFLEGLIGFRWERLRLEYAGSVETVIHDIVRNNCIDNRPIDHLIMGENLDRGEYITAELFGRNISEYLYRDIAEVHSNSYAIHYDRDIQRLIFNVVWGLDRTQEQTVNDWCLFGQQWNNVISERYEASTDYPNFALVYSGDQPEDEMVEEVDVRQPGEELREIVVMARDIRRNQVADMQGALRERGYRHLAENGKFENIFADVRTLPNMPYSLGDIVSVRHERTGIVFYLRITEEREILESGRIEKKITFGNRQGGIMSAIRGGM